MNSNQSIFEVDKSVVFNLQSANFTFYNKQEQVCCSKYEHHELPVFKPSTKDVKAGGPISMADLLGNRAQVGRKESVKFDAIVHGMSSLSLALSLGKMFSFFFH